MTTHFLIGCVFTATMATAVVDTASAQSRNGPAASSSKVASVAPPAAASGAGSPVAPKEIVIGEDGVVRPSPVAPDILGKPTSEVPPSCLKPSPLAAEAVQALIVRVASEEGADARLAVAVARQESGFDRNRVSSKGALGPMQLMPGTAALYGVSDPCDPEQNIRGGVKHLIKLTREFENPLLVLAAYNAGEGRVYEHKGLPPFKETLTFVARIANEYYGFSNTVIRQPKASRSGLAVAEAGPAPVATSVHRDPAVTDAPSGPKWIGGHVLNFD